MNSNHKAIHCFFHLILWLNMSFFITSCRPGEVVTPTTTQTHPTSTAIAEPIPLLPATLEKVPEPMPVMAITATSIPLETDLPTTTITRVQPRGLVFESNDIFIPLNSQGLAIAVQEVRILDREAAFIETYLDQPALWNRQTIVEIAYTLTNSTDTDLIEHTPWSLMVFGDMEREQFEVVRLADHHDITPDGMVLSPGIGTPVVSAGESVQRFLQVGLDNLLFDAVDSVQWVFACPTTHSKSCYGSPDQRYETIVEIGLRAGELVEFNVDQAFGLNLTSQVAITHGGVEVHLERIFSTPVDDVPKITYRSDHFDMAASAIYLGFKITNHASQPRFLLPEIGHLMIGDVPQEDYANVINFTPFFRDGLAFSSNGYYPHLNPVYRKVLAQTPLVLQPGEQIYLGAWMGSDLEIIPGEPVEIFLGCSFPLTEGLVADDSFFPDCLSDKHGENYIFKLILPDETELTYEPYTTALTRIMEQKPAPIVAGITETPAIEPCQEAVVIEQVLGEAVLEDQWGIQYRDNGDNPPEFSFYGVFSGETSALKARGSRPNSLSEIDLVQLYYLDPEGQLQTIWMATGVTTERQRQQNYVSFVGGLSDRQDVMEVMHNPGQFFEVFISDGYVEPDGIAWERCYHDRVTGFFDIPCEIGLLIEEEMGWKSHELVSSGKFSTDLVYGWVFNPQEAVMGICSGARP
jgi:hypothetical protein